ncbi:hypothetical protein T265_09647 [Opisthorchis viverrini]|uniref:Uncharacterized protein n=1 Tax=Opisthorchis viverrini TaxID=6198 RepID=A0A075A488_OPIVI|nr:hypothetical protein T265_09647 [Opisthorchis viverrini]KER22194.1 hypothetical protein T265_09647 [Opisthorchis viverrini]
MSDVLFGPDGDPFWLNVMEQVGDRVKSREGNAQLRVCYQTGYSSAMPSLHRNTSVSGEPRKGRHF